ncbi:MAG: hypothetical protein R3E39_08265 [Anaerolineae bacterium]
MKKYLVGAVAFSLILLSGCATKVTSTAQTLQDSPTSISKTHEITSLAIVYRYTDEVPHTLANRNLKIASDLVDIFKHKGLSVAAFPNVNLNIKSVMTQYSHVLLISMNSYQSYGSSTTVSLTAGIQDTQTRKLVWKYKGTANTSLSKAIAQDIAQKMESSKLIK